MGVSVPCSEQRRHPVRATSVVGPSCVFALANDGFLCCIPIMKAFYLSQCPVSSSCCASRGRGTGWTSKHPPCSTSRAHSCALRSLGHADVLDLSDAEDRLGTRSRPLFTPKNKAFYASRGRRPFPFWSSLPARLMRRSASVRNATWLILPVVICLSQRLSHACVSMN
jgi:hypothetical protein